MAFAMLAHDTSICDMYAEPMFFSILELLRCRMQLSLALSRVVIGSRKTLSSRCQAGNPGKQETRRELKAWMRALNRADNCEQWCLKTPQNEP